MRVCLSALLFRDVLGVVLHVAAVQHGVLGRGDVDERRLHARQHVLHPADVDVAVDLADVVGRAADVVLDQVAALEHSDLGHVRADLHAHQVPADGAAVALAAAPLLEDVEFGRRTATAAGPRGARLRFVSAGSERLASAPRAAAGGRDRAWQGAGSTTAVPGGCRRSVACAPATARLPRPRRGPRASARGARVSRCRRPAAPRLACHPAYAGADHRACHAVACGWRTRRCHHRRQGSPSGSPTPVPTRSCRSSLMRPPRARGRLPAAPTPRAGFRRVRSIDVSVSLAPRASWPGRCSGRPRRRARRAGGHARWSPASATIVVPSAAIANDTICGRTSSTRRAPFRSRSSGSVAAATARSTAVPASRPLGSASSQVTDVTTSCSEPGAVTSAATSTVNPTGSASVNSPGTTSMSASSFDEVDVEVLGHGLGTGR